MKDVSNEELISIIFDYTDFISIEKKYPGLTRSEIENRLIKSIDTGNVNKGEALLLWTDGASRGNPGESGIGVVIKGPGTEIHIEFGKYIGLQTNNVAEYEALALAMEEVEAYNPNSLIIHSDSELMVKQIRGEYKVRNPVLKEYHDKVKKRLTRIKEWKIRHIPRENNGIADELANLSIDEKSTVKNYRVNKTGGSR